MDLVLEMKLDDQSGTDRKSKAQKYFGSLSSGLWHHALQYAVTNVLVELTSVIFKVHILS